MNAPPSPGFATADFATTRDYLFSLKAGGVKFGIDRMGALAAALGHPQRSFPCVHLAGTNGKGSVTAMLDAIFHAAGWHTGMYTSPHLVSLGERVQVDRRPLTDAQIVAFTEELRPHAAAIAATDRDMQPTFFEFMTAMALLHFQRSAVDVGLIEVGLGGRLDATNVVAPEICAITSIGLDHQEFLGDTLELIAAEKGGIIKPGVPVVLGRMPAEAQRTIERLAAERGSPAFSVEREFGADLSNYPTTNLECAYQRWNAATATLVARHLAPRWRLTSEVIARGLQQVNWPGRWQRLRVGGRTVILDASHNAEGAAVLDENLARLAASTGRAPVVVTGALGERRARALMPVVAKHAREIHLVIPQQERASSFDLLEQALPEAVRPHTHRASVEGVFPGPGHCSVGGPHDTIVVTGSLYLLGEVIQRLQPDRPAGINLQDW